MLQPPPLAYPPPCCKCCFSHDSTAEIQELLWGGEGWKRVTLGKALRSLFPPSPASSPLPCRETQQGLFQPLLSSPWRANAELGTHMCELLHSARTSTADLGESWSTSAKRPSMNCTKWSWFTQGPPAPAVPHIWQPLLRLAHRGTALQQQPLLGFWWQTVPSSGAFATTPFTHLPRGEKKKKVIQILKALN